MDFCSGSLVLYCGDIVFAEKTPVLDAFVTTDRGTVRVNNYGGRELDAYLGGVRDSPIHLSRFRYHSQTTPYTQ